MLSILIDWLLMALAIILAFIVDSYTGISSLLAKKAS